MFAQSKLGSHGYSLTSSGLKGCCTEQRGKSRTSANFVGCEQKSKLVAYYRFQNDCNTYFLAVVDNNNKFRGESDSEVGRCTKLSGMNKLKSRTMEIYINEYISLYIFNYSVC